MCSSQWWRREGKRNVRIIVITGTCRFCDVESVLTIRRACWLIRACCDAAAICTGSATEGGDMGIWGSIMAVWEL